jgi:hypothetical protein
MDESEASQTNAAGVETIDAPTDAPPSPDVATSTTPPEPPPRSRDSLATVAVSILILALVACLAVAHGWRKGYVLAPTDALKLVAPWETPGQDYVARNEQLLDQTVQFVPWTIYAVDRLRQGQVPLWNPHSQLGVPFVGNGQSAVFYPTILLHLKLPETWSWTLSAALRLFAAGLGTYLLAGRYGLRGVPRLLSGVAFMLCGFNVVWLNHPQTNVTCLLPWAVLATEALVARVTLPRVLGAALVFALQFLGGHPASCIHLLVACGLIGVLRWFIPGDDADAGHGPRAGRLNVARGGLALAGAVAFGFALAAAQWLPLIEYARHSGATIVRKERLQNEKPIATDPRYLLGILFPYANGFPDGVAPFELRRVTHLPNTNELAPAFVGTVPLLLAAFAAWTLRRRHRAVLLWMLLGLTAAAIAIKLPGIDHAVRKVPGLNVAQNARLLVVTALALSILAGFGLEAFLHRLRDGVDVARLRRGLWRTALVLTIVGVLGALVLLAARGPILNRGYGRAETEYKQWPVHEHSLEHVKALVRRVHTELVLTSLRLLIPATMLGLAALLLWRHQKKGDVRITPAAWPWLAISTLDLLAFAIPYNPGSPAETYFPANSPAVQKLKQLPPARFAGTFRTFMPETSTAYGLSDVRGYDALAPERYYRWWAHPGIGGLPDSAQGYLSRMDDWRHPAWGLLNFGYVLTAADQPPLPADQFKPIESAGNAILYQRADLRPRAWVVPRAETYTKLAPVLDRIAKMDCKPDELVLLDQEVPKQLPFNWERQIPPEAWTQTGSPARKPTVRFLPPAAPEQERPEVVRLQVTGAAGGYLVLADTYFPGWVATVSDGGSGPVKEVPVLPANGVMRAVPLPPSASSVTVELRYRPWSWRIGAMTSVTATCLFALLTGLTLLPGRRTKSENSGVADDD